MSSELLDIADAVTAELTARSGDETFSQSFTAARKNTAIFDLEDTQALQVVVVPVARRKADDGRGWTANEYDIQIAVYRQLADYDPASDPNTLTDPLVQLVGEIDDHFDAMDELAGYTTAAWLASEWSTDPEALRTEGKFLAFMRLTFRTFPDR